LGPYNVALGAQGGAASRNPASSPAFLAREAAGDGLGFTGARSGCLFAAGPVPAGGHDGGRWRAPLKVLLRRAGSLSRATSERGSPREGRSSTFWRWQRPEGGTRHGSQGGGNGGLRWLCVAWGRTPTTLL
jgi:hypothetical protein